MYCVCHAFPSVHFCLEVTCWERADLLAFVCDFTCDFVTFPFGILDQVWCLIVSIPLMVYRFSGIVMTSITRLRI